MLALLFVEIKHRMAVYRVELCTRACAVQVQHYRPNYLDSGQEDLFSLARWLANLLVAGSSRTINIFVYRLELVLWRRSVRKPHDGKYVMSWKDLSL